MRIWSDSFEHRGRLPAEFAMGTCGRVRRATAIRTWRGTSAPAGTRSFVLLCIDTDAPTDASLAGREDVEIPVAQPRGDFVHWVLVDLPGVDAAHRGRQLQRRRDARAASRRPPGPEGARQGLNDYTGWFAGDAAMGGDYYGYDGPYPPPNDLRLHRYFFRLFALDVDRLQLPRRFTAADVFHAMDAHVLGETAIHGTYSLHPAVTG